MNQISLECRWKHNGPGVHTAPYQWLATGANHHTAVCWNPGTKIGTQHYAGREYSDTLGDHNALRHRRRQPDLGVYDWGG